MRCHNRIGVFYLCRKIPVETVERTCCDVAGRDASGTTSWRLPARQTQTDAVPVQRRHGQPLRVHWRLQSRLALQTERQLSGIIVLSLMLKLHWFDLLWICCKKYQWNLSVRPCSHRPNWIQLNWQTAQDRDTCSSIRFSYGMRTHLNEYLCLPGKKSGSSKMAMKIQ